MAYDRFCNIDAIAWSAGNYMLRVANTLPAYLEEGLNCGIGGSGVQVFV